MKNNRKVVVVGAKPLATGSRAQMIDFAAGGDMIIGAEGIPPVIVNPANLGTPHPGAYREPKVYPNPGVRQQLRALRQRERQEEKAKRAPTPQEGHER